MAKIVELIGSPGVGKTTIYQQLTARWNKNHNWVPSEFLFPKEKLVLENYSRFILNILRLIMGRRGPADTLAMEEAGGRFVALYPEYIDRCWNSINCIHRKNVNGSDLRFQKISYFFKVIQRIQILKESTSHQTAIADEGLVQLITSSMCKRETLNQTKEDIESFLQIMPLPDGIISIETDLEENTKRLLQRKKVISMHKSLTKDELKQVITMDHKRRSVINTILETHDIPLLRLSSTDKVATNVSKIIGFAENLR